MKKYFYVAIVPVLVFGAVGCSGSEYDFASRDDGAAAVGTDEAHWKTPQWQLELVRRGLIGSYSIAAKPIGKYSIKATPAYLGFELHKDGTFEATLDNEDRETMTGTWNLDGYDGTYFIAFNEDSPWAYDSSSGFEQHFLSCIASRISTRGFSIEYPGLADPVAYNKAKN